MSSIALTAASAGIPANCKPPVFPWEHQYKACFKAGYEVGSHANLGHFATGMIAGHGPGPVPLLLLLAIAVFLLSRRRRTAATS